MAAAGTVSERRVAWEGLLADVSRVLPKQVYLQSLSAAVADAAGTWCGGSCSDDAGRNAGAGRGSGFSATGVASSHVKVAVVLDRLASLPWLTNVTLVSTANGSASGTTLSRGDTFSVTAGFNPNGGAK